METDPRIEEIREVLPGANCGACGYPGCDGLAAAIVEGRAEVDACTVGGSPVAKKVGSIMGVKVETKERMVARVLCQETVKKQLINIFIRAWRIVLPHLCWQTDKKDAATDVWDWVLVKEFAHLMLYT